MNTTEPPRMRMSLGLRIVFGLSLALNLLILGAVGGFWLRHGADRADGPASSSVARLLYRELPSDDKRAMRQVLRKNLSRDTLQAARIGPELDALLRADELDENALRALMQRQADSARVGQMAMRDGWISVVSQMPASERRAYADRLKAGMDRRRGKPGPSKP